MNFNLLNEMGLGNFDLTYLFIGMIVLIIILFIIMIAQSVK